VKYKILFKGFDSPPCEKFPDEFAWYLRFARHLSSKGSTHAMALLSTQGYEISINGLEFEFDRQY